MVDNGFSPDKVTVDKGTTVTFVNKTQEKRWPASDPHPLHTTCAGFDATKPIEPNSTYSITFNDAKECAFHDHLTTSMKGVITVK